MRVLAPDLIGFGKSDKPKRESVHRLDWHRDLLLQWLDRVHPDKVVLIHSERASALAALLVDAAASRVVGVLRSPDGAESAIAAWQAPFPDRGYEAALRAFGRAAVGASGPDADQASRLMGDAVGYFPP